MKKTSNQSLKNIENIWRNLNHETRNEIICNHSVGNIENGRNTFIEIVQFTDGIICIDHDDLDLDSPFQGIKSLIKNYDWDQSEILDQLDDLISTSSPSALLLITLVRRLNN